jgi:hypothetical protein
MGLIKSWQGYSMMVRGKYKVARPCVHVYIRLLRPSPTPFLQVVWPFITTRKPEYWYSKHSCRRLFIVVKAEFNLSQKYFQLSYYRDGKVQRADGSMPTDIRWQFQTQLLSAFGWITVCPKHKFKTWSFDVVVRCAALYSGGVCFRMSSHKFGHRD